MEILNSVSEVHIRQKKEWGEIFSGFHMRNRYEIKDASGQEICFAEEIGGNFLTRAFLQSLRPFTLTVLDQSRQPVLTVKRPFRWYFHEIAVYDGQGVLLGIVKRRFAWLRRIYHAFDGNGQQIFELFGPILHPWTFNIMINGQEAGKITKRWSGLMKEAFTLADNFGAVFSPSMDTLQKAVVLGAVFLIDFVHFEHSKNN